MISSRASSLNARVDARVPSCVRDLWFPLIVSQLHLEKLRLARWGGLIDEILPQTHDPLVSANQQQYMTEKQVISLIHAVHCPTLVVTAQNGWPLTTDENSDARLKALGKNLHHVCFPGAHSRPVGPNHVPHCFAFAHGQTLSCIPPWQISTARECGLVVRHDMFLHYLAVQTCVSMVNKLTLSGHVTPILHFLQAHTIFTWTQKLVGSSPEK